MLSWRLCMVVDGYQLLVVVGVSWCVLVRLTILGLYYYLDSLSVNDLINLVWGFTLSMMSTRHHGSEGLVVALFLPWWHDIGRWLSFICFGFLTMQIASRVLATMPSFIPNNACRNPGPIIHQNSWPIIQSLLLTRRSAITPSRSRTASAETLSEENLRSFQHESQAAGKHSYGRLHLITARWNSPYDP